MKQSTLHSCPFVLLLHYILIKYAPVIYLRSGWSGKDLIIYPILLFLKELENTDVMNKNSFILNPKVTKILNHCIQSTETKIYMVKK